MDAPRPRAGPAGDRVGLRSRVGIGGPAYHGGGQEGPAESAYLGIYRRGVAGPGGRVRRGGPPGRGLGLCQRIRRAGYRVWFDPSLSVTYWPRESWRHWPASSSPPGCGAATSPGWTATTRRCATTPHPLLAVVGLATGVVPGRLWAPDRVDRAGRLCGTGRRGSTVRRATCPRGLARPCSPCCPRCISPGARGSSAGSPWGRTAPTTHHG